MDQGVKENYQWQNMLVVCLQDNALGSIIRSVDSNGNIKWGKGGIMMKKFFEYLKKKNVITTILNIIICSSVFAIRENVVFRPQTIIFINLVIIGILAVVLFNSVRSHYFRSNYVICILLFLFVFNRFYDEEIFEKTFRFKWRFCMFSLSGLIGFWIFFPIIKQVGRYIIAKIASWLEKWTTQRIMEDDKHLKEENQKEENQKEGEEKYPVEETLGRTKEIESPHISKREEVPPLLFFLIFCLLLFISVALFYVASSEQIPIIKEQLTLQNWLTVLISVVAVLILLVFMAGIILSLLVKWIHIIIDIWKNRQKGGLYFICACGLFLFSQYFFDGSSLTIDDIADMILTGKFFTFPMILSILIPVFLIFFDNIIHFVKNHFSLASIWTECRKLTLEIAKGIVTSSLTFIKFVTSDFLSAMVELTEDDE